MSTHLSTNRPAPDQALVDIAEYVTTFDVTSDLAYETARNCLIDTLGCGLEAPRIPRLHQAPRTHRPRHRRP